MIKGYFKGVAKEVLEEEKDSVEELKLSVRKMQKNIIITASERLNNFFDFTNRQIRTEEDNIRWNDVTPDVAEILKNKHTVIDLLKDLVSDTIDKYHKTALIKLEYDINVKLTKRIDDFSKDINSEKFIDAVVERIKKKQLG